MPDPSWITMLKAVFGTLVSALLFRAMRGSGAGLHQRNRRKARRALREIGKGKYSPAQKLTFLRKIDPFVFEELVLMAFENNGYRAIRNKRYTGDGGKDGAVRRLGRTYLIQCKRYSGYIDPGDVEEFATLCDVSRKKGFFVHTGKTGARSRIAADGTRVRIISGENLLGMLKAS